MPVDALPRPFPHGPHRRTLLATGAAGAAAVWLTACTDQDGSAPGARPTPSAAERLRARAARESAALLRVYDATLRAHPSLADRLAPLREEVARHAAAFRPEGPSARPTATRPSAAPPSPDEPSADDTDGPTAGPSPEPPGGPRQALRALADAERRTADAHTAALADAPPELARLLASVAAAGGAHTYLLTAGG